MPIFEYKCQTCGTMYEVLHLGPERAEEIICPKCKSTAHKRWFSPTNITTANSSFPSCGDGSCSMRDEGCSSGMCPMD